MAPSVSEGMDGGNLLTSAIDTLPISFAVLDEEGRIVLTNRAWREFAEANDLRLCPDTLGGNYLDVTDAGADEYAASAADGLRAVLAGERETFELEYPCHSADEKRWFLLRAAPFERDHSRHVSVAHIDVTTRKRREQALQTAYEVCTDSELTFSERIDALLETTRGVLGTDYATLSRVHGDEYVFEAVATPDDADLRAGETTRLGSLPNCRRVVRTERSLTVRDVQAEAPELADPEWGIRSYLGAPVIVGDDLYGTFCFYSMEPRETAFSEWEVTFVELLSNWVSYELERRRYTDQLTALDTAFPDPSFVIDADGHYLDCLTGPETADLLIENPQELIGRTFHELLPEPTADSLLDTVREVLATGELRTVEYELTVPAGQRWFEARVAPLSAGDYDSDTVIFIARDITEYKERQDELERQRDELAQLQRLNSLSREITKALQDTTTREAIESAVCTHLTESALYHAVWVGTREDTGTVEPTMIAGVADSTPDRVPDSELRLAYEAVRDDEVRVVGDVSIESALTDEGSVRPVADTHSSLAAVPLTAGETTYGVMVVYAPQEHPISKREADILADLGRIIALSIQRVHSQRSLIAATAVELDFRIPDADSAFAEVSTQLNCQFGLERRVPIDDGTDLYYFSVRDADAGRACELLAESSAVESGTVVRDAADKQPALVEVGLRPGSALPLDVLADYGASVTTARVEGGDVFISTEIAPDVNVRAVVEALREVAPGTELLSKQYIDQPVSTVPEIQERVRDQLTPKQEATLKAAYARGYYSWPRGSTAEELAATLDVSAPTLHYRLRQAHQTVMTALFDGGDAFDDTA